MKNSFGKFGILLLVSVVPAVIGCGDDGNTTSTASGSTGSSSGSGGAGGSATMGSSGTELASAGSVVKSKKYKMIINFGASTPALGSAESSKYRLHSGLVGVTEGSK